MRRVLVPIPVSAPTVEVAGVQDAWDRLREMTRSTGVSAVEAFYQDLVVALTDALMRESTTAKGEGWCVIWTHNVVTATEHGEAFLRTLVACGDEMGGQRTHKALVDALSTCGLPYEAQAHPAGLLADSEPVHARWRDWRLGPQRGSIEAVLVPHEDVEEVEVVRAEPLPRMRCPACGVKVSPIPRLHGYPSREAELAIALGEAAYGTDCLDGPLAAVECPDCEAGFVPGTASEEKAIAGVLGPFAVASVLTPLKRLWKDAESGALVWTPFATCRGGRWTFRLPTGVRSLLDGVPEAWLALRPRGLAVVFLRWSVVTRALPSDRDRDTRLVIREDANQVVQVGGRAVPAITDHEEGGRRST